MKIFYDCILKHKFENKNTVIAAILTLSAFVTLSAGCTAPRFQLYEGPLRPSTEISIIKTPDQPLSIIRVDNEYLKYTAFQSLLYHKKWADIVEVEPGEHRLLIKHDGLITQDEIWLDFSTEAGHIYEIRTYIENLQTVYRVIDQYTDETVLTKYGPT